MIQQELSAFCGFDEPVKTLTGIYCRERISGQELGQWFASVDFEALPPEVTCMAAAAAAKAGFSGVPEQLTPRLRGIIKYVHTLNSGMMAGVCALGAALNRAGIPVLLLEDTALYMRYSDGPQRHLWQMCVGVPKGDYPRALEMAREAGFAVETFQNAAVARQGVTRQITVIPVEDEHYLWRGAVELKKGNGVFRCPEAAAILIEISQRAFRALTKPKPRTSMVRWCMDMKLLLDRFTGEDWRRAAQIAGEEHARNHICLLFAAYAAVTGVSLEQGPLFGSEKDARRVFRLLQTYRACPEKGQRARRLFLLYRLRRPDSVPAAGKLFLRHALRKLGIR